MTHVPASTNYLTCDANEAVASVAYRLNELIAIYSITPSSAMAESQVRRHYAVYQKRAAKPDAPVQANGAATNATGTHVPDQTMP